MKISQLIRPAVVVFVAIAMVSPFGTKSAVAGNPFDFLDVFSPRFGNRGNPGIDLVKAVATQRGC
jgi:hypothetical protein